MLPRTANHTSLALTRSAYPMAASGADGASKRKQVGQTIHF